MTRPIAGHGDFCLVGTYSYPSLSPERLNFRAFFWVESWVSHFRYYLDSPHRIFISLLNDLPGYAALNITWTEENKDKFVRQWTRDCKNEPKPLVFDVDGKPLENPADAKGAMNVIDALRVCTAKSSASASRHAKPEELMKLGIDRRNIYLIHFDGDTGVRC